MQFIALAFLTQLALSSPAVTSNPPYGGTVIPPIYPPPGTGVGDDNGDRGTPISATAESTSPGVLSGNIIQVPANIPINACGNTVDVIGVLNPAFGNNCENDTN